MKYLQSVVVFMIFYFYLTVSVKAKSNDSSNFVISKNNPNEKYKNHNMDGWTPIKPTLEYLKLNQRKNCVSIGFYNVDCKQVTEKPAKKTTKYKSIVNLFQRDYHSPYGNYIAEIVPKLPNHYKNPLPRHRQTNRRQFGRFPSDIKRNIELPRFIDDEYPTNRFGSRSFHESAAKYWRRHRYPMFEPIPGQILYPPTVPQFKSNPLNEILQLNSRIDDDVAYRRNNNIKTFQSTIFPFFEHESVTSTKKSSTNKENVRSKTKLDTTSPVFSMVIEPTTIKVSSTTSGIKPARPAIQYVYSVAANHSNRNNILNDFEKELPKKVVIEAPPKKSIENDHVNNVADGNGIISTKLSNRLLEYTTSGYSVYVTIRPFIDRQERRDIPELIDADTNDIPKNENRIKVIPLLHSEEQNFDSNDDLNLSSPSSPFSYGNENRTYTASNGGFMNTTAPRSTKKTTLKPQIYTLSSLLLDTDDQSASHQLSKPGQYVDHLSSAIINEYVGKTQRTERPSAAAEAVLQSSITIKHQPPLPNKSNNQNTTNSRWTQPHELYTINNNDGINDRDQKIKDINLDMVITTTTTTDGPKATTTTRNRNQIYENRNYSGINDGDEWNDGNVDSNSRAFNGYGRVNVEPNVEWIMVAKR